MLLPGALASNLPLVRSAQGSTVTYSATLPGLPAQDWLFSVAAPSNVLPADHEELAILLGLGLGLAIWVVIVAAVILLLRRRRRLRRDRHTSSRG